MSMNSSGRKSSKRGGWNVVAGYLLTAAALLFFAGSARADDQMPPPHPDGSLLGGRDRSITLEVKFNASGHVTSCKALKHSGAAQLDKETIAFVRENWDCPSMAGRTAHVPFDFHAPPPSVAATTNAPAAHKQSRIAVPAFGGTTDGAANAGAPDPSGGASGQGGDNPVPAHQER